MSCTCAPIIRSTSPRSSHGSATRTLPRWSSRSRASSAASPELLVGRHGDRVEAHPLAGTAPRRADPEADRRAADTLAASTKDQWEHRIVIEWFLDELLGYTSYVDAEPEPTIISLPNVHHLGTRIEGRLSAPPVSVLELVAALHPTPAVGGRPSAMPWR